MLFVIGLELDPSHLWKLRRRVFGGGALQLFACALPLGLGLWALGLPWQAALVAGLALGLSSTAVAMQTMSEQSLTSSPVGKTAFAILLFRTSRRFLCSRWCRCWRLRRRRCRELGC